MDQEPIKTRIDRLEDDIREIKDNHLPHIQECIAILENKLTAVKTDVSWIKKFFWIVATTSIGGLITGLIQILISVK